MMRKLRTVRPPQPPGCGERLTQGDGNSGRGNRKRQGRNEKRRARCSRSREHEPSRGPDRRLLMQPERDEQSRPLSTSLAPRQTQKEKRPDGMIRQLNNFAARSRTLKRHRVKVEKLLLRQNSGGNCERPQVLPG